MKKNALSMMIISSTLIINSAYAEQIGLNKISSSPWTGFYFGDNLGGSWTNPSVNIITSNTFINTSALSSFGRTAGPAAAVAATGSIPESSSGVVGGLQLGYNYQIRNRLVAGLEADIQGFSNQNSNSLTQIAPRIGFSPNTMTANLTASQQTNYLGTVRGRLGMAFTESHSWLAYFSGGLAYGEVQSSMNIIGGATPNGGSTDFSGAGSISTTQTGYTVGGGLEKLLASRWSAKIEYLYYDLGTASYSNGALTSYLITSSRLNFVNTSASSIHFNGNIVRIGLNYHFT